ncbi:trehalose operon repressor [Lactobacillus sp. ESL0791]|uniref:trehalose operon repressor n=1 Tax=Lactobacillus sp. ESL0791 TaxID=2983234 RepID=UPI0023F83CC3|nr:trehalose operon repressor [Lactobacillus sp. ESL0791]MDF7637877.1 trehalose operon repressor [Lactobacillus sp. ESL0791]
MESKSDLIAQDITAKIRHQQFKINSFLPSESELTILYGTSRETVRKALDQLNSLGVIQKIRGKGSMVLNLEKYSFPVSGISSFAELSQAMGMRTETIVLTLKKMKSLPALFQEKFPEEKEQKGIYIERLRIINGKAEILDCDFLFTPPITELPLEAAQTSIYSYLENKKGLEVSYATKAITVEKIGKQLQNKLGIEGNSAVLVASHNFLSDATLFQLTLSYHDPQKFKFVDFARRQRIKP